MMAHLDDGSPKGHDFGDDCSGAGYCKFSPVVMRPGQRRHTPELYQAWVDAQTERWKIVATCTRCRPHRPLVAEEVETHRLNHVPEAIRSIARDLARLDPAQRRDVLDLFDGGRQAALKD